MSAPGPLQNSVLRQLLDDIGAGPAADPDRYDVLQRRFDAWWESGGSVRGFVAKVEAETRGQPGPAERMAAAEARFAGLMAEMRDFYASR